MKICFVIRLTGNGKEKDQGFHWFGNEIQDFIVQTVHVDQLIRLRNTDFWQIFVENLNKEEEILRMKKQISEFFNLLTSGFDSRGITDVDDIADVSGLIFQM